MIFNSLFSDDVGRLRVRRGSRELRTDVRSHCPGKLPGPEELEATSPRPARHQGLDRQTTSHEFLRKKTKKNKNKNKQQTTKNRQRCTAKQRKKKKMCTRLNLDVQNLRH